ncbi:hypothetical protein RCL1_003366 [Eukaryota sp. TZLM3-RCL]
MYFPKQVVLVQSKRAAVEDIVNSILEHYPDNICRNRNPLVAPSFRNVDSSQYPPIQSVGLVMETTGMTLIHSYNFFSSSRSLFLELFQ